MVPCGNRSLSGAVSARHRFSVKLNQAIGYGTIKPGLEIRTRCVRGPTPSVDDSLPDAYLK